MNFTPEQTINKNGLDKTRNYLNAKVSIGDLLTDKDMQLQVLIQSHDIVEKHNGLATCKDILSSVESRESEYGGRLGVEYKKSSDDPQKRALMLCDDGSWCACLHTNDELNDSSKFLNIKRLEQAVADVALCKNPLV